MLLYDALKCTVVRLGQQSIDIIDGHIIEL